MKRSDSNWNDAVKCSRKPTPKVPEPKKISRFLWSAVESLLGMVLFCLMLAVIVLAIYGVLSLVFGAMIEQQEKAKELVASVETSLRDSGYVELPCGYEKRDYIAAEALARRRCDYEFGLGNYQFESTNFNGSVWYWVKPKN